MVLMRVPQRGVVIRVALVGIPVLGAKDVKERVKEGVGGRLIDYRGEWLGKK